MTTMAGNTGVPGLAPGQRRDAFDIVVGTHARRSAAAAAGLRHVREALTGAAVRLLARWHAGAEHRHAIEELSQLDDRLLADIGLQRGGIESAVLDAEEQARRQHAATGRTPPGAATA